MPKINVDWNKCHECGTCVTAVLPWFLSFKTFQIRDCDFETLRLMLEKMVNGFGPNRREEQILNAT